MKELRIIDIIGTQNAILHKFGLQVFDEMSNYLCIDQPVNLSFQGLRNITSGFCNASIGKAHLTFKNADRLLSVSGIEKNDLWQELIHDAIQLANNPSKIKIQDQAISELLES